ncbi:hypothetical protein C0J52_24476 [Blattella germanica]|nr:hypothetical protein C0J52_24476 [Blattella germanica]
MFKFSCAIQFSFLRFHHHTASHLLTQVLGTVPKVFFFSERPLISLYSNAFNQQSVRVHHVAITS